VQSKVSCLSGKGLRPMTFASCAAVVAGEQLWICWVLSSRVRLLAVATRVCSVMNIWWIGCVVICESSVTSSVCSHPFISLRDWQLCAVLSLARFLFRCVSFVGIAIYIYIFPIVFYKTTKSALKSYQCHETTQVNWKCARNFSI